MDDERPKESNSDNMSIEEELLHGTWLYSIKEGNFQAVEKGLVDGTIRVNFADYDGRTGLHIAAENNRGAIVRTLLDHGADVRARDSRQMTPLQCAETPDIKYILKFHGAASPHKNEVGLMKIIFTYRGDIEKYAPVSTGTKNLQLHSRTTTIAVHCILHAL